MSITAEMLWGLSGPVSLIGREQELRLMQQVLQHARSGAGGLVLVSGQAGIGKTTLIRTLAADALELDMNVIEGCCYDLSTTPPYGLWLDLSDRYRAVADLPEMPDVLKRGTGMGDLESQVALFEVARDFFASLAHQTPVLLLLEDLHWADQASLDLLRYLSRYLERIGMLVVASYRDDEVTRQHPLYSLLPSLIRESDATRIDLSPLNRESVTELVRERWKLGERDESRLVDHVMRYGEGNPLFTIEMLRAFEQGGHVRRVDDGWQLESITDVPVPALAEQIIDRRFQRIDEEARHYLEIAAIIGQEVNLDVWQRVAGVSEHDLLPVLDQALDVNVLVQTTDDGRVRFDHALTREALYRNILAPRRRIWHRLIAEALEDSADWIPDSIAYHYQQAGNLKAVDWLIKAGEWAQRTFAWRIAVERFRTAGEMLQQSGTRVREQGWLRYRSARLSVYLDPAGGVADLDVAIQIAAETGDAVLHAASLVRRGHLLMFESEVCRAVDEMTRGVEAWDTLSLDEKVNCEFRDIIGADPYVNVFRGTYLLMMGTRGWFQLCLEQAENFIAEMEAARDRLIAERIIYWLDGYPGIGCAYAAMGHTERARELFISARDGYAAINVPAMESFSLLALLRWVHIPYETDRVAERRHVIREIDEAWTRSSGGIRAEMTAGLNRVLLLYLEGEWDQVNDLATRGKDWHANSQRMVELLVASGRVARHQGFPELAWEQVQAALPNGPATEPGHGTYFIEELEMMSLAVELELDAGKLESARTWLDARDRWLDWAGVVRGVADAKLLRARHALACGNTADAKRLADEALQLASEPRQPWSLIGIHRFLGKLTTTAGQLDEAQHHLSESLELASACEIPFERAYSLVASAELAIASGDHPTACDQLNAAREIAEDLGAKPVLEHIDTLLGTPKRHKADGQSGLTARELDVLDQLMAGKSDREIADDLFISHHTVMRHVSNILRKLDVSSRTAAVSIAVRNGIIQNQNVSK